MPAPSAPRALPGHSTPAVGFDTPFEMLAACHERVTRSLRLLLRLADHLEHKGWDEPARQAARDVLRYFDLAAPLHHEDEERHVFPRAREAGDPALAAAVQRLQRDHQAMQAAWTQVRVTLQRFAADAGSPAPLDAAERAAWQDYAALYDAHLQLEEQLVFPAAASRTDAQARRAMGEEMAARRRR